MNACRRNLIHVLGFGASIILIALLLSAVAKLWVALPWWSVFRRCISIAAALSLLIFMKFLHRQPLRTLGLGAWSPIGRRHLRQGLGLGGLAIMLLAGVYLATGLWQLRIHPDTARVWRTVLTFVPAAGLISVLEELIFRGYLLQQLLACSKWLAMTVSSAVYAVVHLKTSAVWPNSGFELIGLFLLGVVLSLSTLRTGQLYLAIGLHASLAYWARVNKLLVGVSDPSFEWLTGSSRLVNGMFPWVVLLGLAWVVGRQRRMA